MRATLRAVEYAGMTNTTLLRCRGRATLVGKREAAFGVVWKLSTMGHGKPGITESCVCEGIHISILSHICPATWNQCRCAKSELIVFFYT